MRHYRHDRHKDDEQYIDERGYVDLRERPSPRADPVVENAIAIVSQQELGERALYPSDTGAHKKAPGGTPFLAHRPYKSFLYFLSL